MKIKICGLNNPKSIKEVSSLFPDMIGLIFYDKSKRYVGGLDVDEVKSIPSEIKKVGVFVNSSIDEIQSKVKEYELDLIQLHGDENVGFVEVLKQRSNIPIIKVFRIRDEEDLKEVPLFEGKVDYFLFDTKGVDYGGNGEVFDWKTIQELDTKTPIFLSGGLGLTELSLIPEDLKTKTFAVDLNSKLEIRPGIKDPDLVKKSIEIIRNE